MTGDPAFWAIIVGAVLMTVGTSPLLNDDVPHGAAAERGCVLFVIGFAVLVIAIAVRALP